MIWSLALATALAGSATGPGVPIAEPIRDAFEPMTHIGIEGGGDLLVLSNGGAFGLGPSGRIWFDTQDANMYRIQASWSWTGHRLTDAAHLFEAEVPLEALDGYVSTHSATVGAKVMLLAQEKKSSVRLIDPWLYSGMGVSFAFGQVAWAGIPEPVSTMKAYFIVDGAAGLDIRPHRNFSFGPVLRATYHPGIRRSPETGKFRYENQIGLLPALSLAVHF